MTKVIIKETKVYHLQTEETNKDMAMLVAEETWAKKRETVEMVDSNVTFSIGHTNVMAETIAHDIINQFPELSMLSGQAKIQAIDTITNIVEKNL